MAKYDFLDEMDILYPVENREISWTNLSRIIRDPEHFSRVCQPPVVPLPGKISTFESPLKESIKEMNILTPRNDRTETCSVNHAFGVYKDEDYARFILHPKELNKTSPSPPIEMPTRDVIHEFIREHQFADEDDARDYFYRFPLHEGIQKHFATRIAGLGILYLTKLCMGWRTSMAIAQSASNLLCRAANDGNQNTNIVAHADNFILGAKSKSEFWTLQRKWKRTMHMANISTKRMEDLKPRQSLQWLGLLIDLKFKTIRAPVETVKALHTAFEILDQRGGTYRDIYKIFGAANYARHMMGLPLFQYRFFMRWFSRKAIMLASYPERWDQKANLSTAARRDLKRLIGDIAKPLEVKRKFKESIEVYTDASTTGGGYMVMGPRFQMHGWKWTPQQAKQAIHRLEGLAMFEGVKAAVHGSPHPQTIIAYVDNTVVVNCWDKYRARDPYLARILDWVYHFIRKRGYEMNTVWVPTAEQKADSLSR
eukprot:gene22206-1304_t